MSAEVKETGFVTIPSFFTISFKSLQSAIHLSWSAVMGNPYFADGMMVPFNSIRLPSATVVIVNDFSSVLRSRLLDGVKKPSDARFEGVKQIV